MIYDLDIVEQIHDIPNRIGIPLYYVCTYDAKTRNISFMDENGDIHTRSIDEVVGGMDMVSEEEDYTYILLCVENNSLLLALTPLLPV